MKKIILLFSVLLLINCSENTLTPILLETGTSNSEKILSNTISKLTISGDSLYIFTDLGYSLASDITNPTKVQSFENDINNGFIISYFKGLSSVYNGFSDMNAKSFNVKTFEDGSLRDEISHQWLVNNPNFNVLLEMTEYNEELYCARLTSGMTIVKNREYYLSLIDTIAGNIQKYPYAEVTDTTNIFEISNFQDSVVTIPQNDVNGVKYFNNQIVALTWAGIYTSTDGDVWYKNQYMKERAKECIEASEGFVNSKKILYTMYRSKVNHTSWDTLYAGNTENHGLYVSDDNLETFTYFPKFKDKVLGSESFVNMSSFNDKIIIATSDSIYSGIYNGTSFIWKSIPINSTMATSINCVAVNDDSYFLGSDNVGVLYSDDFSNWNYITKNVAVQTDLKEVYAYPTTLNSSNSVARFAYSISEIDSITIEIFDYNSDLVKTIITEKTRKAGTVTEKSTDFDKDFWDGKNNHGRFVSPGTYKFRIKAKNQNLTAWGRIIVGVLR